MDVKKARMKEKVEKNGVSGKEIKILEEIIQKDSDTEWQRIYHNNGFASYIIYRKAFSYVFYSPITRCYIAKFYFGRLRKFKTERRLERFLKENL